MLLARAVMLLALSLATGFADETRIGCFNDKFVKRDLPVEYHAGDKATRQFCFNYCKSKGFKYVGLQASDWCNCGNTFGRYGRVSDSECRRPCKGDSRATCGGNWANEIFIIGQVDFSAHRIGCFNDKFAKRDLQVEYHAGDKATRQFCWNYCISRGFNYVGLQASDWCYCGNTFGRYGRVSDSKCQRPCKGDSSATCGGNWANEIFATGLAKFKSLGCFTDDADQRDLPYLAASSSDVTLEKCQLLCKQKSFQYFGVQNGKYCNCGSQYGSLGDAEKSKCNVPCAGNGEEICGGNGYNSIYLVD